MKQASRIAKALSTFVAATVIWQPLLMTKAHAQPALNPGQLGLFDKPFLSGEEIPPYVMLAVTKDQQLFKKAYDDFSDVDGDGTLDTTYLHAIDYYGYFDSYKCYTYSAGSALYEPVAISTNKYCAEGSGQWSGNFLNWTSMTRMDALRKVLFGGLRSPSRASDGGAIADGDTTSGTVLERAYLPYDAHSWTKYYDKADLPKLAPFTVNATVVTGLTLMASAIDAANPDRFRRINRFDRVFQVPSLNGLATNQLVEAKSQSGSYLRGRISQIATSNGTSTIRISNITCINVLDINDPRRLACKDLTGATGNLESVANWSLEVLNTKGITMCNTTNGSGNDGSRFSQNNPNLPRIKVARGNYSLWNANERWQCTWAAERNTANGNDFALSGVPAATNSPNYGVSLGPNGQAAGDYFVRVRACVDGLFGKERCTRYNDGNYKPTGLLQKYGELGKIYFGLLTGSFNRNLSGGVLRKNIGAMADEINVNTDGTFKLLANSGVGAVTSPGDVAYDHQGGSIITTLSKMRIVGYDYNDGSYIANDNCSYQRRIDTNGACKSWGNPISEIYFEALRYFSGQVAPTPEYVADDSNIITGLATAKWPTSSSAVLSSKNYCAPLNMLVINGAVTTNEQDADLANKSLSFMAGSPTNAVSLTNQVGSHWGINGGSYFYGNTRAGITGAGANTCSAKGVSGLGEILGICPEGPTTNGSYLIAGLAHHAHTNRIRTDIPVARPDSSFAKPPFHLNTYGVSLSAGLPRIPLKFADEAEPRGYIIPAYLLLANGTQMGGALVDMRIIKSYSDANFAYGEAMVSFEDSEAGGDYDMDVWGVLSYEMDKATNQLRITTDVIHQATGNPQGFGYVVSGTNADGRHFHSGIIGFNYVDPTPGMSTFTNAGLPVGNNGGCNNCEVADGPTTAVYNFTNLGGVGLPGQTLNKNLEDPLYYASLFGGFEDSNADKIPNKIPTSAPLQSSEFDKRNNKTGVDGADGIPDNYFRVDNPLGLEIGLERAFQDISQQSSLSALGAQTTRVTNGSKLFQASFNSGDWSGSLAAFNLTGAARVGVKLWEASGRNLSSALVNPDTRKIVTTRDSDGSVVPFRWPDLSANQQALLNSIPSGTVDGRGQERLAYLRGDGTLEGAGSLQFRQRINTKLGDIVTSSPVFVGEPNGGLPGSDYLSFYNIHKTRTPVVYVGANDGMVHGFDAATGDELFGFVPSQMYRNLSHLTMQDYSHRFFVDGLMTQQDAKVNGQWGTYLAGGMGKGAQGVYLLDVTNPNNFANEGSAQNVVKWEFTDKDDADMGYVYSAPIIRLMPNNKWAVIFSAGYNATEADSHFNATSGAGKGAIYIAYLSGPGGPNKTWRQGVDYFKLQSGEGTPSAPNAFGGVTTVDNGSDGNVDYIYAGDIQGNLWRFFIGDNPSTWASAANRFKKFTATSPTGQKQSITSAPEVVSGPNSQGVIVTFGTGRLLERRDVDTTTGPYVQNAMYGIWDKPIAVDDTKLSDTFVGKSDLMLQRLIATENNAAANAATADLKFSLLTAFVPNYTRVERTNTVFGATNPDATGPTNKTQPQLGWMLYEPSIAEGERTIYKPEVADGVVVYVNIMPSADICGGGGSEAQYVLDVYTGGRNPFGGFDRDGNGKLQSNLSGGKDQATFGQSSGKQYYSSRRESTGGFGQVTMVSSKNTIGSASDPKTCAGGSATRSTLKSMTDKSITGETIGTSCVGRAAWREVLLVRE
jgi:type IV pilus assembly protein PilY1